MFKIKIEQPKLIKALKDIAGSVGRGKMDNPTDASVYMRAYNDNGVGKVKFLSTNFNEWTSSTVETIGPVDEGISPLVSHTTLMAMIGTINPTFEVTLEELKVQLLSIDYVGRKSPIEVPALMAGSFIVEPESIPDLTIQIPCGIFKQGLEKASRVISDDPQRLLYNSVNVTLNTNNILFEAIDSVTRRVMVYVVNHANPVEGKFFVEANKIKSMIAGFDDSKPMDIEVGKNNIRVMQDGLTAILRLTFGTFPPILTWFPTSFKSKVVFQKDEMINSLKRIQAMYDNQSVMKIAYCDFENMFSSMTMNSQKGKISEAVTTTLTGSPFKTVFSVDTLLKTLFSVDGQNVEMVLYDNDQVSLSPENPTGFEHKTIVMQPVTRDAAKTA